MSQVVGELRGVKPSVITALDRLTRRRFQADELLTNDFLKRIVDLVETLGVQVGFLIDREGRIDQCIIGKRDRLYLPDLGRQRVSSDRLCGLRLMIFHPTKDNHLVKKGRGLTGLESFSGGEKIRRGVATPEKIGSTRTVAALAIPSDFITDIEKLRLDCFLLVPIVNGEARSFTFAHLDPNREETEVSAESRSRTRAYYFKDLQEFSTPIDAFIYDLERSFSQRAPKTKVVSEKRAILVGAYSGSPDEARSSMEELHELARTAGLEIAETIIQRRPRLDPKTLLGSGKIEELTLRCLDQGVSLAIFDRELSPSQLRAITGLTDLRILDRSMLILDIFAQRAKSAEGRLQVELAQLRYSLPRLSDRDSGLSRLSGGIGGRGPGETKLEISRRRVRDRIHDLEQRIDDVSSHRSLRRQRRNDRGVPVVAIVGYTNSGKSTLLNSLTKSDVLAENKLFATLDPSSRRMKFPNNREAVFVDTVGFIRELPKELVSAFRATLEEVGEADVLLHLVDASNPNLFRQIEVVNATLADLGFSEKPQLLVLNKCDRLTQPELSAIQASLNGLCISAMNRTGLGELLVRAQEELGRAFPYL
jgi:GTPase